jgi:hypothetical protein
MAQGVNGIFRLGILRAYRIVSAIHYICTSKWRNDGKIDL